MNKYSKNYYPTKIVLDILSGHKFIYSEIIDYTGLDIKLVKEYINKKKIKIPNLLYMYKQHKQHKHGHSRV